MLLSTYAVLAACVVGGAPPPEPPAALKPWVDYAREVSPPGPACPAGVACVQLSRVEVRGRGDLGRVTLSFTGMNLDRAEGTVSLLKPAATFAVTAVRWKVGRGAVSLSGDSWLSRIRPGPFQLELDARFEPQASVPLQLDVAAANIVDKLERGALAFDESSDRHGGVLFLTGESRARLAQQELSVRTARSFKYGSVVTFVYRYNVSGLREQARVELPRIGGESFEALEPDIPYTVTDTAVVVTLTPGRSTVEASGHFPTTPTELKKPAAVPFEHWLFDSDPRHPVELKTDGVEIDPGEVPGLVGGPRSRAFFLVENQRLTVSPLAVALDAGRQGAGVALVSYSQGRDDHWVGSLRLTSTAASESDRIVIPTPAAPHYAQAGGEAVRMFGDGGTLSLRVVAANDQLAPISVQWREDVPVNDFLSAIKLTIPGQSLHLDEANAEVRLLPGYVPIVVLGAEHATGHLVDGLHIYAILIALLGVALARTARFPISATVIAAVLLAGLYTVEGFPRIALLCMLAGCAVLVRLPETLLGNLRQHRVLHGLLSIVWLAVLLVTLIPAVIYIKDRIYSALHPWSEAQTTSTEYQEQLKDDRTVVPMPPAAGDELKENQPRQEADAREIHDGRQEAYQRNAPIEQKLDARSLRSMGSWKSGSVSTGKIPKATEKTIRPVALDTPQLPAHRLAYSFGSLLPGTSVEARVLLAGPILRGLWMFAECIGFGVVLGLLIIRARRWWSSGEVRS
jgi:hypothetical protein